MAKAPDPRKLAAEKRAEVARNSRYVVTVDGESFTFRLGEVTAVDVRELRREAGMGVPEMVAQAEFQAGSIWDIDSAAALIWMARRQAGDLVPFSEVAESLRLDQVIEIRHEDTVEPVEAFPDPLAEAAAPDRPARAGRRVRGDAVAPRDDAEG